MAAEYTTNAQKVYPPAAANVSVTPNASAWASSNWTELTSSTAAAIVITGLAYTPGAVAFAEIDIGKGAAASEVVVTTLVLFSESTSTGAARQIVVPIPVDNIPTGTRVAVRMRQGTTDVTPWTFAMMYYEKPIGGTITVTAQPSKLYPPAAAPVSVTPNASAWVNSSYTEVVASTATAIILGAVAYNVGITPPAFELDIAIGAAASEVVVTTLRGSVTIDVGGASLLNLVNPLDAIPASSRIAVRMRKAGTSVVAWTFKLLYYEKPL